MSDFRRKLFEWLEPDWLEEAGRFPVPGQGGRDRDHEDGDGELHGGDDDRDEDSHLHCALKYGWLGGKPL